MFSDKVDMKDIAAKLLDTFDLMIERQNAYRDRHGEDAIHDIQYDQQMRDPIGTMRKVYERLDEPFTPPVDAAMQKMMAANAKGRIGQHEDAPDESGLKAASDRTI